MKSNAEIGRAYVEALAAKDLDAAAALWKPGSPDNLVGIAELVAPGEVTDYFRGFFAAIPDLEAEIISVTADEERSVVHWRMRGTFNGTGKLLGLAPNGRSFDMLGTDVLTIENGLIVSNTAITNGLEFARQLAIMPPAGSRTERAMFGLVNALAPAAKAFRARKASRTANVTRISDHG